MIFQIATLICILILIALELPHRVRSRRRTLKRAFVDEGISLARRHRASPYGAHLSELDEHRIAIEWAKEQCAAHRIKVSDSELSKLVAIRKHPL